MNDDQKPSRRPSVLGRRVATFLAAAGLAVAGTVAATGTAQAESCKSWGMCIYEHGDGNPTQGIWWDEDCLAPYTWDANGEPLNDSISRVRTSSTWEVTLYQHCYFGGGQLTVPRGTDRIMSGNWAWFNDMTSSWIVKDRG
ncbi:hypothetical protein [Streptomyces sp. NPDC090025]|uniref:hypothetical protein n=1 Tax=Streptomyces sp. NPDC090025 TaxID=3365922 RepID=UPI003836C09A